MVNNFINPFDREHRWLLLPVTAIVTLVIYSLLPSNSLFVERFFSLGLFAGFRVVWDYTLARLPIPLLYLLLVGVIYFIVTGVFRSTGWKRKVLVLLKRIIISASALITMFYWLWGFNYKRVDVRQTLQLTSPPMSVDALYAEYQRVTDSLNVIRDLIGEEMEVYLNAADEVHLRKGLEQLYDDIGLKHSGHVRVRKLLPKGSLLRISTAGVYLPFVGEGHIDAGLHPITHPFTIMHEMSHGYGWTGEDVCNFLALIGNVRSENPVVRYSGYLGYWRYLRSNALRADKERFEASPVMPSELVKKDYNEILAYQDRYPDIMPKLRDMIYDNYLKSHGISDGLVNYSAIVTLAYAWQQRYGSLANNPE